MRNSPVFVAVALTAVLSLAGCAQPTPPVGDLQTETLQTRITKSIKVDYLLFLPADYGKDNRDWPLVLFLHGAGERGDNVQMVKKEGLPKLLAGGKQFPFIVVAPQCPLDESWDKDALIALLDDVTARYRVDRDRICVTGLSMGGYGTWALAAACPDRFAAIVPICGGGSVRTAPSISHVPAWVFHGARDNAVPLQESEDMVIGLRQYGSKVKFTIYPDASHDCWSATYAMPELYDWMLQQRRRPAPAAAQRIAAVSKPVEVEAEMFTLKGAQVAGLIGASGDKGVRFEAESDAAETKVRLPAGGYEIDVYMFCSDGDHDSITLDVGGHTWNLWHNIYGKLAAAQRTMRFALEEPAELTVSLRRRESGVIVDRVVFRPLY